MYSAPPRIYTLSLHDALPILLGDALCTCSANASAFATRRREGCEALALHQNGKRVNAERCRGRRRVPRCQVRSEEHTSELQSLTNLVCRLLLEKKKNK